MELQPFDLSRINWTLCVICQETTKENLQCPAKESHRRVDIGSEVGEGKWHKSCQLCYNATKLNRARKRIREDSAQDDEAETRRKSTRANSNPFSDEARREIFKAHCFFCEKSAQLKEPLHGVSMLQVDHRVRRIATETLDTRILAKLSEGDMIAIDAVYHSICLSSYYNKERSSNKSHGSDSDSILKGVALAEVVSYMEEEISEKRNTVFKMTDLIRLYTNRLEQLGVIVDTRVNSTHLKERILALSPDLIAEMKGRDTYISCRGKVGEMLQMAYAECGDDEGTYLAKAANIVRRDIFTTKSKFDGTFSKDAQKDSVPKTLLTLISMILNGSDLTAKNEHDLLSQNQACLSVSQMVVFNSFKRRRDLNNMVCDRHSKDREPPLPVHLGLRIYSQTRQSKLVDEMFRLGLSVSYDRVLEIENTMVRSLCTKFDEEGVVCPPNLAKSVFTTSAYDNLDHDPSSTTAKEAFHGTGISIFQHPDDRNTGQCRDGTYYKDDGLRKQKANLPEEYSTIKPMMMKNKNPPIPENGSWKLTESGSLNEVMKYGTTWLDSKDVDLEVFYQQSKDIPQFRYWSTALELEILLLTFVRSLREGNFQLYIDTLCRMGPWFFAMDKVNYSRWLPVHLRDMLCLSEQHPDVYRNFLDGKFVVHNSEKRFSGISIDHAHEQNNKKVKGQGGIIGITTNENALHRWLISGPQISALTEEFKNSISKPLDGDDAKKHHEETTSFQKRFSADVCNLQSTITEFGNPFLEESTDSLIVLHTGNIRQGLAVTNLERIEEVGRKQFVGYVTERLHEKKISLSETITRNKLSIFSSPKVQTKQQKRVASLKNDVALFSRLFIACQNRDGNIEEFFRHENQSSPPSLSQSNELRSGNKAELLKQLESMDDLISSCESPETEVTVLDGAALINGLKPESNTTFEDYAAKIVLPRLTKLSANALRIDVVFDVYLERSLKNSARVHRGQGSRRRVKSNLQVPTDWKSFLRHSDNKTELFSYLAQFIHENLRPEGKTVIVTKGENALCWPPRDTSLINPCNHEEADTRIFVHVKDAQQGQGMNRAIIHTVDTDVVVLGVAAVVRLKDLQLTIAFGSRQYFRYINANKIAVLLGEEKAFALPMFHAFTGCDTVSFFAGKGKKSAMKTWEITPTVTQSFLSVEQNPSVITDEDMAIIEQFVVYLYHPTSESSFVNEVRLELFAKKNRAIENIPPTHASLLHHVHRAALQANCWKQMFAPVQSLVSPEQCGWTCNEGVWQPRWTDLPEVADALRILVKCGCKKGCKNACKCRKAGLECTALCFCSGDCN
eukprot:Seg1863.1 transcript_id=Seg1863.1/GoldUCD/mRNA.D3Y31 product="hypothetical protein" protein_id=Seg1863.1/GoldUCD/D3Y31